MNVVLISTYELGHQPFGLASPAAWLRDSGARVTCLDLSRQSLPEDAIRSADFIAFYLPMHTATRLAAGLIESVRKLNGRAHLCAYGLYAPANAGYFRHLGVHTVIGGEFEEELVRTALRAGSQQPPGLPAAPNHAGGISLRRLNFRLPDRSGLPRLSRYAPLILPDGTRRVAGYTEASRGCKHLCRHCPVVPVYNGAFRVVQREVVLADIRQQVQAGAQHITFGDPDFFNGPAHALSIAEALHREFPLLTYDVTIKIEHLLRHSPLLSRLRATGCLFVTSAVESADDAVLQRLDKGHTRADFLHAVRIFRDIGLVLLPTFVPFTPWTTLDAYRDLLALLADLNLIENVTPVQLGIRLLIPAGSRLLELPDVRRLIGRFDPAALLYPWTHPDPRMDELATAVQSIAAGSDQANRTRLETFAQIWRAAEDLAASGQPGRRRPVPPLQPLPAVPRISEPWYCCAEPTHDQFVAIGAWQGAESAAAGAAPSPEGFL